MPKKRKVDSHLEIAKLSDDPSITVDRDEILKLTREAKSWDFTCTFCFKRFASAQAMGGHQNAHKGERLEEKRLFVKDPIGYRKRAYLLAMKSMKAGSSDSVGGSSSSGNLHASVKMVKNGLANINDPQKDAIEPNYLPGDSGELNDLSNNNFCQPGSSDPPTNGENLKKFPSVLMNFLPPKELSLAESVGSYAQDAKAKACVDLDIDNHGINFEKLDLTLKL